MAGIFVWWWRFLYELCGPSPRLAWSGSYQDFCRFYCLLCLLTFWAKTGKHWSAYWCHIMTDHDLTYFLPCCSIPCLILVNCFYILCCLYVIKKSPNSNKWETVKIKEINLYKAGSWLTLKQGVFDLNIFFTKIVYFHKPIKVIAGLSQNLS